MNQNYSVATSTQISQSKIGITTTSLGESFLHALATQNYEGLEKLYQPAVRFRAIVPSGEREGKTAGEAVGWFRKWFGNCDTIQILQSTAGPVFDRLFLSYRLRLNDQEHGWRVIEQQAYCDVQDGQIAGVQNILYLNFRMC